eukprot:Phypoly_transcript_07208.p1 GENE.Phypoly_transcript_07208~~Phypoly_transcript_07208.p1  ORF type:complete len:396 (+),score=59.16 Phypoly_transcript_07208:348-1535(+)
MNRKVRARLRKILKYIKTPVLRLVTATFVFAVIAVIGLIVSTNPPSSILMSSTKLDDSNPFVPADHYRAWDTNFNYTVLIDVHHHPNGIDPDTLIQWFIASGYNAVVLTEHNTIENSLEVQKVAREKYNDQLKVLIGMEWTNCRMHMGLLGISKAVDVPKLPTDQEIQDVINNVHAQGGLTVVNHPPWSYWAGLDQPSLDDLIEWGVDFFDVTTYERLDLQLIYYAESKNMPVVAGTDSHELGAAHAWTLLNVNPNNITEESIMDALRSKKTSFIFDEVGYQPPVVSQAKPNPWYTVAYPWIIVGNFFHSYYDKVTGTYSFVNGYCGFGEMIVVHKNYIWATVFWALIVWLVLEGGWGLIKLVIHKIQMKINPNRAKLLQQEDEGEQMDVWDTYL